MFSNTADIDKGMDVLDVNGEKIGTVDEVYSSQPGSSTSQGASTGSGGGAGALGDESRVDQTPGHGGQGVLGNQSRVGTNPGGGSGALGSEGMVDGTAGADQTSGSGMSSGNAGSMSGEDEIVIVEEEVDIPVSGEMSGFATDERYFKVEQGGILGIGAKSLYIPFSAVQDVVAGNSVTLDCTKDECDAQYGSKPAALQ